MKIVLISNRNPHFITNVEYMEKAFRHAGHDVVFFNDREYVIPGRLRRRFGSLQDWDLERLNRNLLRLAHRVEPDLCITIGGYRLLAATIMELRRTGIRTTLLTTDAPIDGFRPVIETAPLYDHVFCSGSEAIEILGRIHGLEPLWVPFACDPDYHHPASLTPEERKVWGREVVFVGSYYPNRWEILRKLTDFDLGIWGPGWRRVINEKNGNYIRDVQIGYEDWIRVYSASKIVVIIHFQDGRSPCYQASPKVYEALACRSFVMVDQQRDVLSLFQSGQHLVTFSDVDDLREKLHHYLRHDQQRASIASEGCREVLEKHTYRHRVLRMLDHIGIGSHFS
jgi:spore maturation protein CgeB